MAYLDKAHSTVRSSNCELLVSPSVTQCQSCQLYRPTLRALCSCVVRQARSGNDRTDPSSHTPFRNLTTPEKEIRYQREHTLRRSHERCIDHLKEKLEKEVEDRGVAVDECLHQDLTQIMQQNTDTVLKSCPPGSFGRIFWECQKRATSLKDARSMRWDPLMVRWCLYLRHLSSSAYEMLRDSGVMKLPSQRTLRDYTHHTKATIGFSLDVDKQLSVAANLSSCEEREKYVILIADEMHIKENLVYDKHTGTCDVYVVYSL